jgi:hypothetical protein
MGCVVRLSYKTVVRQDESPLANFLTESEPLSTRLGGSLAFPGRGVSKDS